MFYILLPMVKKKQTTNQKKPLSLYSLSEKASDFKHTEALFKSDDKGNKGKDAMKK